MTDSTQTAKEIMSDNAAPVTAQTPLPSEAATPAAVTPAPITPAPAAPPPVTISRVHMSFVWAELLPPFLEAPLLKTPWVSLTRRGQYEKTFAQAQKNANLAFDPAQPARFQTIWRSRQKICFWNLSLTQTALSAVEGPQAWENLVPLRGPAPYTLQLDSPYSGVVKVEPFYYPFGMALAIHFELNFQGSPEELVKAAFDIRRQVEFTTSAATHPVRLSDFADATLQAMRDQCLGVENAQPGRLSPSPISIVTVIEATGVDAQADVLQDAGKLRIFEALSNWRNDWRVSKLPDTKDACLEKLSTASDGSALYARARGRVAWFPAGFTPPIEPTSRNSLKCYHHNLAFAAMQVEALSHLIAHAAKDFNKKMEPDALFPWYRSQAGFAAVFLAKLYQAEKGKTWRSRSTKQHIKDLCFDDLNTVLSKYAQKPLAP